MDENSIAKDVVNVCFEIHKELGPGLLESVYEEILTGLLIEHGYDAKRQAPIPIEFRGKLYELGFRADLIIEDLVLIELKSIEQLNPVHFKQTLTYIKMCNIHLGLLVNFNVPFIRDGIRRVVNNL